MSRARSLQVRRRSDGFRLIIEAVEGSHLHAERSDGRLKLSFATAARSGGKKEVEECGAAEGGIEEQRNGFVSEKEELDGEMNLLEKFQRFSRCEEGGGGHASKGLCSNSEPATLWKMLFSAMDSTISLMREVELKEKAAEQAKDEAAMGGTDILAKSEELKQIVKLAEEINSKHAGKVYSEKAILATELRELHSRALSLSVERDRYLALFNEKQQTLEVRLSEAENAIKSAELEKIEKENVAMEALTEQELIMEKVLQESMILKQEAEDNVKLREFLVDHGCAVDTMQGEISVIRHNVRLLKETFGEHTPFSKSLSSSQTSCILASSASSSKSLAPEQVESLPDEGADSLGIQEKKRTVSCSTECSSRDEAAGNDHKALSDDDWEMFDADMLS